MIPFGVSVAHENLYFLLLELLFSKGWPQWPMFTLCWGSLESSVGRIVLSAVLTWTRMRSFEIKKNYTDCSVIVILTTAEFTHLFIYYRNTAHHVLVAVKGSDSKQKGIWWRVFLELHHISLWVTASSIFKAFLPSEARATNCTSQAGQDGIHRTALPLISPPSAANQTHHIAAFCLLTAAGAKKVNSCSTSVDKKKSSGVTGSFCVCLSLSLCSWSDFICRKQDWTTACDHSLQDPPQPSHCHQDSNAAVFILLPPPPLFFFFTARPALSFSVCIHNTVVNYCVNVHSEHLQLNWEYWIADN